ncbi:MAG: queuosine precursor transporter [Planctomycetota bacterium]|jgi:uncharacterized integral membrane protein (TIGR00697 family)
MRDRDELPFAIISALFVAALVVCNLIANKFVTVDLGFHVFVLSAGVLPYPLTFLVTDILSEIYGKKRANQVVISGFFGSFFVLGVLWLGAQFPALADSKVDDETYFTVFHNAWRVILASMTAYLCAQLVDIRVFHAIKNRTKGKHLWLRNNLSTITSQLLDTVLVIGVLFLGEWSMSRMGGAILDGWSFKVLCALIDTPVIYGVVYLFHRYSVVPPARAASAEGRGV